MTTHFVVRQKLGPLSVQSWHDDEREALAAFAEIGDAEDDDTLEAAAVIRVTETVICARGPLSAMADPSTFSVPPAASRCCAERQTDDAPQHEPETRVAELRHLLEGAAHALRSYQHGNASPELAEDFARRIEEALR